MRTAPRSIFGVLWFFSIAYISCFVSFSVFSIEFEVGDDALNYLQLDPPRQDSSLTVQRYKA